MEIVNVLQTPPVFFRLFLKLALYLFHSAVTINYRSRKVVPERPSLPPLSSFDVNTATGFFPKQPLPHLPAGYSIWEDALREANNNLILGDRADEDEAKCKFGEQWRDMINAVSPFPSLHVPTNAVLIFMTRLVACPRYHPSPHRPARLSTRPYGASVACQLLCPFNTQCHN